MKKQKFWTAHEKVTDKAIVTINASDEDVFHKTCKKLGRAVNWRNATNNELSLCEECNGSGIVEKTIITDGEFAADVCCDCAFCNGTGVWQ